jgi:hypothetical protein
VWEGVFWWGRVNGGDEGEGIWLIGLHIHIQNRAMKPLGNCFKWGGGGVCVRVCVCACVKDGWWGNLTNVQCKAIGNWHNESPLYNEYMLIKMKRKRFFLLPKFC